MKSLCLLEEKTFTAWTAGIYRYRSQPVLPMGTILKLYKTMHYIFLSADFHRDMDIRDPDTGQQMSTI